MFLGPSVPRNGPRFHARAHGTGNRLRSVVPAAVIEPDPTIRAHATADLLLERYGVVTRGSVMSENVPGGFALIYKY